jgi:hypothetical protein
MKDRGTFLSPRSSHSSSQRLREGGSPLRPGADGPLLFCSPSSKLIFLLPLSRFSVGRLPCFEANLPLSSGEVPVPERRSARRRWNSLRSRGQAASMSEPAALFLAGEFRCCPRQAARVPGDETLERRDRDLPTALYQLRAEDLSSEERAVGAIL